MASERMMPMAGISGGSPKPRKVMAASDGSYGIEKGLICSFPIRTTKDGGWEIVQGLPINAFSQEKIDATVNELKEERDAVSSLLKH